MRRMSRELLRDRGNTFAEGRAGRRLDEECAERSLAADDACGVDEAVESQAAASDGVERERRGAEAGGRGERGESLGGSSGGQELRRGAEREHAPRCTRRGRTPSSPSRAARHGYAREPTCGS